MASAKTELRIESKPQLANIYIWGRNTNLVTPETLYLPEGIFLIGVKKAGYDPFLFPVLVVKGEKIDRYCELVKSTGEVVISSSPSNAKIFVDGVDTGRLTPEKLELSGGAHNFVLKKTDHDDFTFTATIIKGEKIEQLCELAGTPDEAEVVPPGILYVASSPNNAGIFVDGVDTEKITPEKMDLLEGEYEIVLKKIGYDDYSFSTYITQGEKVEKFCELAKVSDELDLSLGELYVASSPKNAKIFIDGVDSEQITPEKMDLLEGEYEIVLKKIGYDDYRFTTTIVKGKKVERYCELVKIPDEATALGELYLDSSPSNAKIFIDDVDIEAITPERLNLPEGTYNLVLKKKGFDDYSFISTIVKGEKIEKYCDLVKISEVPDISIGELYVASSPNNAGIFVDGVDTEKITPEKMELSPGDHDVLLKKTGYDNFQFLATIVKGEKTDKFCELLKSTGEIVIASSPSNAKIFVDDVDIERITPEKMELSPGRHNIILKKPDYDNLTFTVTIVKGEKIDKFYKLIKSPVSPDEPEEPDENIGRLYVVSSPTNAGIFVDGTDTEKITPEKLKLPPGTYDIILKKAGFDDLSLSATIVKGEKKERFFELVKSTGQLVIVSTPNNAKIFVDNVDLKRITPEKLELSPGTRNIKLVHDGFADFTFTATIIKGEKIEKLCRLKIPASLSTTVFQSLSQSDVHLFDSWWTAELIRDITYDPAKASNAQLSDDIRICFAWYSSLKEDKKLKFTEKDVIRIAKDIYVEIEKRKQEGKMKHDWNPGDMKPHSKELFDIISHTELSMEDTYPSPPVDVQTLPIYPGTISEVQAPVTLEEFLDMWESFSMRKPFISLVGSLANWETTLGDIDIVVKAKDPTPLLEAIDRAAVMLAGKNEISELLTQVHEFIKTDSLFLLAKWRIERAFPEWQDRMQILDGSFSGPFTNFVDLADLTAVSREEKKREEMQKKKLKLFKWRPLLKPIHGRKKEEIYSIDSVIETIKSRKEDWYAPGIYVEKKHDGIHVRCDVQRHYESGHDVIIFSEEGNEITKNLPTMREELAEASKDHKIIIVGELELWKDEKHQPRAQTAAIIHTKEGHPDEKNVILNVFDCLYYDKDIHELPFSKRIEYLNKIAESEHIKKGEKILCHSEAEVRKAMEKMSKKEGSEGAYLKKADFVYELDGKTLNNIKFKNEISLEAVVLKKNKVAKTEKTFYYHCGLKSDSEIVYCGKTFNTNIDAKVGDILKVIFVDVSGYTDPKTKKRWVNWWSPRVSMLRENKKEPDTIDTAWKMVEATTGRFAEKAMPDIKNLEQLETKGKRFVVQMHFRGSSTHLDFRVQINNVLKGFTIIIQYADILKDELSKRWKLEKSVDMYSLYWDGELAYQLDKKEKIVKQPSAALKKKIFDSHVLYVKDPKYWQLDLETGEEIEGREIEEEHCLSMIKSQEPIEWLDVEGVTAPREIEPEPGGTRFYPGVFVIIDEGVYYPGAMKSYFKEYFLEGKKWKDRFIFRLVASLKGTKAVADWLFWKPIAQSPYVLSARAITKEWLPSEGSALTPEWEAKLPAELAFWKASDRKKQFELRKLAREYLKKKKMLSEDDAEEFILTRRHWRGQYVIRGLPFEDWHLKIGSHQFHLDKDPTLKIPDEGIAALEFEDKKEYFVEGEKKPKSKVNPNLKLSAFIEVLDKGEAELIAEDPLYLHIRFNGSKLKGLYNLRRTSKQSEFWTLRRGMLSFS